MKKYLKYLSFLAIILCFSISKVYADSTRIDIDYSKTNTTANTIMEEIKQYFDNNNEYNHNYMINYIECNSNNFTTCPYPDWGNSGQTPEIQIIINMPFNGDTSYIDAYYVNLYKYRYSGSRQGIAYQFTKHPKENIGNIINGGAIFTRTFKVNDYNTYKTQIQEWLYNRGHQETGSNSSAADNMDYVGPSDVEITSMDVTQYMGYIYYSTFDLYYIFNRITNAPYDNRTPQEICTNGTTPSNYLDSFITYETTTSSITLSCGDNMPTLIDYNNNQPNYTEQYNINYTKEIKSIDIYHALPNIQKETWKIEIENNEIITPDITIYGKKCNNTTCYWEIANNGSINNINTEKTNDTTTITFEEIETIGTYTTYKIAIEINTEEESNIKIYNIENSTLNVDINTIGKEYSIETYIATTNTGILVNGKNSNINYRTYTKRDTPFKDITYYQYHKSNNLVKEDLQSTIFKIGVATTNKILYGSSKLLTYYYIQTTSLEIGNNSDNSLYILLLPYENSDNIYYIYYSTDVYYTKSNNLTFTIDYNNTQTTTTLNVDNAYITNNYNNITNINLSDIENIVLEYEQYKDDWLELWESIYEPLPNIIKNIMILLYTGALTYGIFLIWKD